MKKRFKRLATVLMCMWNLYMPNDMQQPQLPLPSTQIVPAAEEVIIENFTDDFVDSSERSKIKRRIVIKRIVSFVPSLIWSIIGLIGGLFKYPLLFLFGLLILLFVGWLLLRNKPWISVLGIGVGSSLVYVDIQDANRIVEEGYLGVFLIVYFVVILIYSLKYKKEEIIFENV